MATIKEIYGQISNMINPYRNNFKVEEQPPRQITLKKGRKMSTGESVGLAIVAILFFPIGTIIAAVIYYKKDYNALTVNIRDASPHISYNVNGDNEKFSNIITLIDNIKRSMNEPISTTNDSSPPSVTQPTSSKQCCPSCGREVDPDWTACPYCKSRLQNVCPACGKSIESDWTACPHCGHDLKTTCPSCGRELQPDWTACPYCKTPISRA